MFGLMSALDTRLGKRKTVNMNEEIAQDLNKLANMSGKTLYSLINEIGIQAIEANRQGFTLEEAVKAKKLVQSARRSRMVLVNQGPVVFRELRSYERVEEQVAQASPG